MSIEVVDPIGTGQKIKQLARSKGYTVSKLAEVLEISEIAIYKWYDGSNLPKIDNLIILKSLFGCSIDDLLDTRKIEN